MNVLSYGKPFFIGYAPLELYRGPHDVRTLGGHPERPYEFDYVFDPARDSITDILGRMHDWRPDLIICWIPEDYPPPMSIEDAPVPTVATVSDWNLHYRKLEKNLARYDVVLCDTPGVEVLRSEWVQPEPFFPLYSIDSRHHHPYPGEKDLDVVFVGGFNHLVRPERAHFLERLAKMPAHYRICIATGYKDEAYGRLLSRARIVFNHGVRGEINCRVLETMACGSLAVLEEANAGARRWFEDGRDIVLFNGDNFEERIQYYLEHPDKGETIAARGHARAHEFAGENRLDELIEFAAGHRGSGRRFHELPPLEQDYETLAMLGYSFLSGCRAREKRLVERLLEEHPDDPRAWTALGICLFNSHLNTPDENQRAALRLRAFCEAHRLDPHSAPRALSAAYIYRLHRMEQEETDCLGGVLDGGTLDGAGDVIGDYSCRFWLRWRLAYAKKTACIEMLQAEAHLRLAAIEARHGRHASAEAHIVNAADLDPDNLNGVAILAEAQWATGRQEEAVETFEANLPDHPFRPEYRLRLCEMLEALGRLEEAKTLAGETDLILSRCEIGPDNLAE